MVRVMSFNQTAGMKTRNLVLFLLAVFSPIAGRAADLVYSGSLVQVANGSISVRLYDGKVVEARLPKNGNLSAGPISSQYNLADQVEITCKSIDTFLDTRTDHYFVLELKKLRFLRPTSPDELLRVRATLKWKKGENLLTIPPQDVEKRGQKPSAADSAVLAQVRKVNLEDAANMPNFIADEKAERFQKVIGSSNFQLQDTVESEIAFHGSEATRQRVRIDGKAWNKKSVWLPGINWGVGFGAVIKPLLDPECENIIEFKGQESVRGRSLSAYAFSAPSDSCFGGGQLGQFMYSGPVSGRILVDDPGGRVLQMEIVQTGFPSGFEMVQSRQVLVWSYVTIGDRDFLVPVAGDYFMTFAGGDTWHIAVEYKNHKHFETSIKLKVQ